MISAGQIGLNIISPYHSLVSIGYQAVFIPSALFVLHAYTLMNIQFTVAII